MSFYQVDDQFFLNPKAQELMDRGVEGDPTAHGGGFLWVMAGSQAKSKFVDGIVTAKDVLGLVKDPEKAREYAGALVDVGLWHGHGHDCVRCEQPPEGGYVYHDWADMRYEPGAMEKERRAKQSERNNGRVHDMVWTRDRVEEPSPGESERAFCCYCLTPIKRSDKRSEIAPEIDHIDPERRGLASLALSCRRCNRKKGNRRPEDAGMVLHVTAGHRKLLEPRGLLFRPAKNLPPTCPPMFVITERWPLDTEGRLFADTSPASSSTEVSTPGAVSLPVTLAERAVHLSPPTGAAERVDCLSRDQVTAESVSVAPEAPEQLATAPGYGRPAGVVHLSLPVTLAERAVHLSPPTGAAERVDCLSRDQVTAERVDDPRADVPSSPVPGGSDRPSARSTEGQADNRDENRENRVIIPVSPVSTTDQTTDPTTGPITGPVGQDSPQLQPGENRVIIPVSPVSATRSDRALPRARGQVGQGGVGSGNRKGKGEAGNWLGSGGGRNRRRSRRDRRRTG